jgi:hypothetical protein
MQQIKKIADLIVKQAVSQKHVLTLQLDRNSVRNLEKVLGTVNGFSDITTDKIQFQIPITINSDVTNVVDFETSLNNVLKRKSLSNVKLEVKRSVGRPTRLVRPVR